MNDATDKKREALRLKSSATLELDRVLSLLSDHAVSPAAGLLVRALVPADTLDEARRRSQETSAACHLLGVHGCPHFSGIRDVGASLSRAAMGGTLNPRELLDIACLLSATRNVKAYRNADARDGGTAIDFLFSQLNPNKYLEDRIGAVIVSEEEIADTASTDLYDLRRKMRQKNNKMRETLQKMISSPATVKLLQDPIITLRSDRFCLPVKAEHRGEVPGLVHDVSSSGSTFFIEPMSVVQMGNEMRELLAAEEMEIERILSALSVEVDGFADSIRNNFDTLVALDFVFAKAKYSYDIHASAPQWNERGEVLLKNARHPLIDPKVVVPITVRLGGSFDTLVVTGPNTGGKTVTLKTLGLLCLMAACGLHLPADDDSTVPLFSLVLSDIGDEQSIEQSLSTFSSHIKNIVSILEVAGDGTLALFDELGAGTDPVEGAALATAIIQAARSQGALIAATTHYAELKVFALTTKGVENASCEFDVETLRPTYKLLIGVPGKSNAFAISRRLGLREDIIEAARQHVALDNARFEDVLSELERRRQDWERKQAEADVARQAAREDERKLAELRAQMEKERDKHTERARAEARLILEQARQAAEEAMQTAQDLSRRQAKEESVQALNDARADLRRSLRQAEDRVGVVRRDDDESPARPTRPIVKGDSVELKKLGTLAHVLETDGDKLTLQAGIMKVTVQRSEVRLAEEQKVSAPVRVSQPQSSGPRMETAARELDLRGMASDEALLDLDRFIDGALMSGLTALTVIHGKGTGVLRTAVQKALRQHPSVKSFRLGRYGEGEQGVTIVELK